MYIHVVQSTKFNMDNTKSTFLKWLKHKNKIMFYKIFNNIRGSQYCIKQPVKIIGF